MNDTKLILDRLEDAYAKASSETAKHSIVAAVYGWACAKAGKSKSDGEYVGPGGAGTQDR